MGSSINTDIRLYYVESYSYELAVSGVALLVVLTVQLFWPSQHVLHVFGLGAFTRRCFCVPYPSSPSLRGFFCSPCCDLCDKRPHRCSAVVLKDIAAP